MCMGNEKFMREGMELVNVLAKKVDTSWTHNGQQLQREKRWGWGQWRRDMLLILDIVRIAHRSQVGEVL